MPELMEHGAEQQGGDQRGCPGWVSEPAGAQRSQIRTRDHRTQPSDRHEHGHCAPGGATEQADDRDQPVQQPIRAQESELDDTRMGDAEPAAPHLRLGVDAALLDATLEEPNVPEPGKQRADHAVRQPPGEVLLQLGDRALAI